MTNSATRVSVVAAVLALASAAMADPGVLRMANWNVANGPNTTEDRQRLARLLDYSDDADGRRWDLLALSETDVSSAGLTVLAFGDVYTDGYDYRYSTADAGGDRTAFVFDASTLAAIDVRTVPGTFTHTILRGTFGIWGADNYDANRVFTAYSVHLASGDANADAATRAAEASALLADVALLPDDRNVVFLGDFNWLGSGEGNGITTAHDLLTSIAFDPVGAGDYRDNADFLEFHTQNPAAAMDDRFDAQLPGLSFADGVGLEYVAGSYAVLGNNGTHALNGAITTGTAASASVLSDLAAFSDHLPVYADYVYDVTPVPEPGGAMLIGLASVALLVRRRSAT